MKKHAAKEMKVLSLKAVESLMAVLATAQAHGSAEEVETFARAVGDCIGRIEVGILSEIYAGHPELDDQA